LPDGANDVWLFIQDPEFSLSHRTKLLVILVNFENASALEVLNISGPFAANLCDLNICQELPVTWNNKTNCQFLTDDLR